MEGGNLEAEPLTSPSATALQPPPRPCSPTTRPPGPELAGQTQILPRSWGNASPISLALLCFGGHWGHPSGGFLPSQSLPDRLSARRSPPGAGPNPPATQQHTSLNPGGASTGTAEQGKEVRGGRGAAASSGRRSPSCSRGKCCVCSLNAHTSACHSRHTHTLTRPPHACTGTRTVPRTLGLSLTLLGT